MSNRFVRRVLDHFEEDLAGGLMAVILIVLGLQVFTRYVLGNPLSWTEEVARHLFIWMVFFGASAAIRNRSHVCIDVLVMMLGPRPRVAIAVINNLLVLFFLGNVLYWGAKSVGRMWNLPTATLEIPIGLVYAVLPLTAVLMIVRTVIQIGEDLRKRADGAGIPPLVSGV